MLIHKVEQQNIIEDTYNRKLIEEKIRDYVLHDRKILDLIYKGIVYVKDWIAIPHKYPSKQARIDELSALDISKVVHEIIIGTAYFQYPELFTSVVPQIASRIGLSDRIDAITTVSELLAILCNTDLFDITKTSDQASLMLVSNIKLDQQLIEFIEGSQILPPMICRPRRLEDNYWSGYITHQESLILGKNNYHNGDICVDVLDIMNSVVLKLDEVFITTVNEEPKKVLKDRDQITAWKQFTKQSEVFYKLMLEHNNKFYITHKVDTRGRIYSHAYHINTMGAPYKKASLEFYKEELVTGI